MSLPRAFLSYAHADDRFLRGRIGALREAVQDAVQFETGDPFEVFLDRDAENGIQLGQDWQDRLDEGLGEARFLIPILSPNYFASGPCRDELTKFLELERRAGRKDLLLPILINGFSKPVEGDQGEIARLKRLALQRQYADWSTHIFEPFDQADGLRRIMALAKQIATAINRAGMPDPPAVPPEPPIQPSSRPQRRLVPGRAFRDVDESWCPELVVIPAGRFLMGSPEDEAGRFDNEGPQHEVRIAHPFALGRHAVTRGEFGAFVGETGHLMTGGIYRWDGSDVVNDPRSDWRSPGFAQTDRHPAVGVSWEDAQAYCAWLSERTGSAYRLPSEAEWEYACRAGTTAPFWTGATISTDLANYHGNFTYGDGKKGVYRQATVAVDDPGFPANRFGLSHMHGNVWEWCEDVWHGDYEGAPSDGSAWTDGDPTRRVLRGGSWGNYPGLLRSALRFWLAPGDRDSFTGFRVARTFTP